MGGEKNFSFCISNLTRGSPPHGRGKVIVQIDAPRPRRITPAWAGKRAEAVGSQMSTRDHPRMGGEKIVYDLPIKQEEGSPPHGRGKGSFLLAQRVCDGITPAWAGKSTKMNPR